MVPRKKRKIRMEICTVCPYMRRKSFGKHCHQNRKERPNDQKQSKNQKLLKCLHHQYISFLGVLSLFIILWWFLRHCKPFQPNQKHRQVWKWQICFVYQSFEEIDKIIYLKSKELYIKQVKVKAVLLFNNWSICGKKCVRSVNKCVHTWWKSERKQIICEHCTVQCNQL